MDTIAAWRCSGSRSSPTHGNLAALEAVLEALEWTDVDAVFCGGDLVGYGPRPNEVCRLIEERGIPAIYGNYDYAIARDLDDCGCAYRDQHDRDLGQLSVAWTLEHTDRRSKRFMRDLPFDLRFEMGERRVRLVHGSPRKVNEYGSVLFVNCGSVGKPEDGDPRAAFDVASVAREVEEAGLPGEYAEKLMVAA